MQKVQDNGPAHDLTSGRKTDLAGDHSSGISSDKHRTRLGLFLIVSGLVVIFDQLSKLWVRSSLELGVSIPLTDRLSLTHVRNTGSAFGLLANQTFLVIIVGIAGLFIILLFLRHLTPATILSMVSIGLLLGGAVGNLMDRLRFGYVTDFIDFRLWGNFHWPTFNIADAALTVGVFTFICYLLKSGIFRKTYERNHQPQS